jgi:hypothetical protein
MYRIAQKLVCSEYLDFVVRDTWSFVFLTWGFLTNHRHSYIYEV